MFHGKFSLVPFLKAVIEARLAGFLLHEDFPAHYYHNRVSAFLNIKPGQGEKPAAA
jgi:hypothetical protein